MLNYLCCLCCAVSNSCIKIPKGYSVFNLTHFTSSVCKLSCSLSDQQERPVMNPEKQVEYQISVESTHLAFTQGGHDNTNTCAEQNRLMQSIATSLQ